ncbi:MAG: V-type ATP synthase subunit I [Methanocorpusculum sp.]|nr:V-type ATP synthase subunit I [Methanocorpusculum parvum]MBQ2772058.1 V-type ATP synthase subunit I [Methanocorpusculum sp.]
MFQPKPMTHLLVAASKEQMASVVTELYRHRVFHITDFVDQGKEGYEGVKLGVPFENAGQLSSDLIKIRSIENVFQTSPGTQFDVPVRPAETIRAAINNELPKIDAEVSTLTAKRSNAETKIRECEQRINELKPFALVPVELDLYRGYETLAVYAGYVEKDIDFAFPSEKYFAAGKDGNFLVAFVESANAQEAEKVLSDAGFVSVSLPTETGTVQAAIDKYNTELTQAKADLADATAKILEAKAKYADLLAACDEVLSCDVERAEAPLRFATTEEAFVLDGWVPYDDVAKIEAGLTQATGGKVYVTVDEDEINYDEVPVEYNNPSFAKPAEVLMDLYARPKFKELDPTIILSIMFPLLFGVIVGDVGYGLIYLALALVLRKLLVRMGEMGAKAFKIILGCGISTVVFGLLYSEIFGLSLPWHSILFSRHLPIGGDHLPQVMDLLVISVAIGVIYLTVGWIFGMINHARMDHKGAHRTKAICAKFGWLAMFWGMLIILFSLIDIGTFIAGITIPLPNLTVIGLPLTIVGAVLFVLGAVFVARENPLDLMEIPTNLLSHMLSFCRIAAVGLSSVAIAMVVNFLAMEFFIGPAIADFSVVGVLLIIVGVLVLIIGHALNVVLGVIGGALHPVRLHYVEFFTKFYQGGGVIYKPFGLKRKFSEE